mmetsp:Transcript_11152/g.28168  ORF Transcript_11152/g.28168 Transcript_11152/m.28168 type:complete len:203 (-) Transcript_11152:2858-3466(-)
MERRRRRSRKWRRVAWRTRKKPRKPRRLRQLRRPLRPQRRLPLCPRNPSQPRRAVMRHRAQCLLLRRARPGPPRLLQDPPRRTRKRRLISPRPSRRHAARRGVSSDCWIFSVRWSGTAWLILCSRRPCCGSKAGTTRAGPKCTANTPACSSRWSSRIRTPSKPSTLTAGSRRPRAFRPGLKSWWRRRPAGTVLSSEFRGRRT